MRNFWFSKKTKVCCYMRNRKQQKKWKNTSGTLIYVIIFSFDRDNSEAYYLSILLSYLIIFDHDDHSKVVSVHTELNNTSLNTQPLPTGEISAGIPAS